MTIPTLDKYQFPMGKVKFIERGLNDNNCDGINSLWER